MINTCPVPVIKGFHGWKLLIADSKWKTWRSPYLPQGTANKFLLIPACRTRACLSLSVCMGGLSSLLSSLPSFSRLSTPMWLHWEKSSWWSPRSFSGGNFSFQQHRLSVTLSLRFPYVNVMWGEQVRWPFGEWEIQVVKTEIMRNSPLSNEHPPSFVHEWVHIDAGSFIFRSQGPFTPSRDNPSKSLSLWARLSWKQEKEKKKTGSHYFNGIYLISRFHHHGPTDIRKVNRLSSLKISSCRISPPKISLMIIGCLNLNTHIFQKSFAV